MPQPWVTAAIGRSGATSGTLEKSNGLATSATRLTGSFGSAASASSARMPPRHQPTTCTGAAGVGARGPDRRRHDVLDPVLEAEVAVGVLDLPVVDEVGRAAAPQQVLGHRAAAAQVEADGGRGQRRDEQHRLRAALRGAPSIGW